MVPPTLKVTGFVQRISVVEEYILSNNLSSSLIDLCLSVPLKIVGNGTFNEGIHKPFLTVPINTVNLVDISTKVQNTILNEVNDVIPGKKKLIFQFNW